MHGLGRIPSRRDARDWTPDRLEAMLSTQIVPVSWLDPVTLDQGETPHCVGYGCAGFLATAEIAAKSNALITNADGERIYREAKAIDGDGEDGSSVRSGAKALQKQEAAIAAYAFGSFDQAKKWVDQHGPVIIGIDWTEGMFHPSKKGVIKPTGENAGGHCLLWRAADVKIGCCRYNILRNSWGSSWGVKGDCYISDKNLKELLNYGGEACMAVRVK